MTGKIRGVQQAPGTVRIKGALQSFYSPYYQRWITKAWPKGHGADSPRRAQARSDFKTSTQVIKNASAEMWQAAEEWAKNSPYLARDILMAASMGTFSEITMADGTTKVSLRVTNRTIQQLLDSIGFQPGTMLVRTTDEWQALLPGDASQVLTVNAVSGLPDWADAQGGSGGSATQWGWPANIGAASASATATKATVAYLIEDITVSIMSCFMNTQAGATYQFSILELDATGKIIHLTAGSATFASPGALTGATIVAPLTAPVTLTAGKRYAFAISRTDGSNTNVTATYGSTTLTYNYPNLPFLWSATGAHLLGQLAKAVPAINDTFTTSAGCYALGMKFGL